MSALLIGSFVLGVASSVRAETRLEWDAPSGCPDAEAVRAAIDRARGGSRAAHEEGLLQIDAEVERSSGAFNLNLEIRTSTGTSREQFAAEECALFARLIAVKVSLLAAPKSAAPARLDASAAPAPAWSLGARAVLATTPLPAPAFGVALAGGYSFAPLRLGLRAGYLLQRETHYAHQPAVGGSLQAWFAGLYACAVTPWVPIELSACAGAETGIVRGKGLGVSRSRLADRPWFALSAGLRATALVSRMVGVSLDVDALFTLARPEFSIRNLGLLHRPGVFGLRVMIGCELRFP